MAEVHHGVAFIWRSSMASYDKDLRQIRLDGHEVVQIAGLLLEAVNRHTPDEDVEYDVDLSVHGEHGQVVFSVQAYNVNPRPESSVLVFDNINIWPDDD